MLRIQLTLSHLTLHFLNVYIHTSPLIHISPLLYHHLYSYCTCSTTQIWMKRRMQIYDLSHICNNTIYTCINFYTIQLSIKGINKGLGNVLSLPFFEALRRHNVSLPKKFSSPSSMLANYYWYRHHFLLFALSPSVKGETLIKTNTKRSSSPPPVPKKYAKRALMPLYAPYTPLYATSTTKYLDTQEITC